MSSAFDKSLDMFENRQVSQSVQEDAMRSTWLDCEVSEVSENYRGVEGAMAKERKEVDWKR